MHVDAKLVRRVVSGDRESAGRVVEAVWLDAFRIALSVTWDENSAEDAAQEACTEMPLSLAGGAPRRRSMKERQQGPSALRGARRCTETTARSPASSLCG